ncbi:MAG: tRNA (N6-threonylcarbamoyladenosine(37)-N6)-methyltransferase TrmO [Nanobdellota archaeon]
MYNITPIGWINTPYTTQGDTPRQPDYGGDLCTIEIYKKYEEGLRDLEGFSHIYVLCIFNHIESYHLIAHPPHDGKPHGVFATRSPFRPNPVSLSLLKLEGVEGNKLYVRGADLMDKTPVIDIKPYTGRVPEDVQTGWYG